MAIRVNHCIVFKFESINDICSALININDVVCCSLDIGGCIAGLGSSTVDQVLKYTKYPKYIPSTSTGQVLIFLKVLKYIKYFYIKYKYKYSY